jgi:hypothetical protein
MGNSAPCQVCRLTLPPNPKKWRAKPSVYDRAARLGRDARTDPCEGEWIAGTAFPKWEWAASKASPKAFLHASPPLFIAQPRRETWGPRAARAVLESSRYTRFGSARAGYYGMNRLVNRALVLELAGVDDWTVGCLLRQMFKCFHESKSR